MPLTEAQKDELRGLDKDPDQYGLEKVSPIPGLSESQREELRGLDKDPDDFGLQPAPSVAGTEGRPLVRGTRLPSVNTDIDVSSLDELSSEDIGGYFDLFAAVNNPDTESQIAGLQEKFGEDAIKLQGNNILIKVTNRGIDEFKVLNSPEFSENDLNLLPVGVVQFLVGGGVVGLAAKFASPFIKKALGRMAFGAARFVARSTAELAAGVGSDEAISELAGNSTEGFESLDERRLEQATGEVFGATAVVLKNVASLSADSALAFRGDQQIGAEQAAETLNNLAGAPPAPGFVGRFFKRRQGDRIRMTLGERTGRKELATLEGIAERQPNLIVKGPEVARDAGNKSVIRKAFRNSSNPTTTTEQEAGSDVAEIITGAIDSANTGVATAKQALENEARMAIARRLADTANVSFMARGSAYAGKVVRDLMTSRKNQIRAYDAINYKRESELIDQIVEENADLLYQTGRVVTDSRSVKVSETAPTISGKVNINKLKAAAIELRQSLPDKQDGTKVSFGTVDSLVNQLASMKPEQSLTQLRSLRQGLRDTRDEIAAVTGNRKNRALNRLEDQIHESMTSFIEDLASKAKNSSQGTISDLLTTHERAKTAFKAGRDALTNQGVGALLAKDGRNFVTGDVGFVDSLSGNADKFRAALDLLGNEADKDALKGMVLAKVAERSLTDLTTGQLTASKLISDLSALPDPIKTELLSPKDITFFKGLSDALDISTRLKNQASKIPITETELAALADGAPKGVASKLKELLAAKKRQATLFSNDIFKKFADNDPQVVESLRADDFVSKLIPSSKNAEDIGDLMDLVRRDNPALAKDISQLIFERTFTTARQRMEEAARGIPKKLTAEQVRVGLPKASDIMKNLGGDLGNAKLRKVLTPKQFEFLESATTFLMNQENTKALAGAQVGQLAASYASYQFITELRGGLTVARLKLMAVMMGDENLQNLLIASSQKDGGMKSFLRVFGPATLRAALRQGLGKSSVAQGGAAAQFVEQSMVADIENTVGAPTAGDVSTIQELDAETAQ